MPRILYFTNKRNPMKFLSCDRQWPGPCAGKKVGCEDKLKHEHGRQAEALARGRAGGQLGPGQKQWDSVW